MANNQHVPPLYMPSLSVPQINVPQINVPHLNIPSIKLPYYKKQERRHVKDLGDIILGHPITGTKQLRNTLEDHDLDFLVYVPLLNRIAGAAVGIHERNIKPLLEGKPLEAGINALETVGNTLDLFSNPIKSLMPWAGGGSYADFLKSMGWMEDEYREIYQWDTGSFVLDVVGEMVSDPVNWVSFFGKQGAKLTVDVAAEGVERAAKKLGYELTDEAQEVLTRTVINTVSDSSDDVIPRMISNLETNKRVLQSTINNATDAQRAVLNKTLDSLNFVTDTKRITALYDELVSDKWFRVYNAAKATERFGKAFDAKFTKFAYLSTPQTAFGYLAYQYAISPTFKRLHNKFVRSLQDTDVRDLLNNRTSILRATKKNIAMETSKQYKKLLEPFEPILKQYNVNVEKLIDLYKQLIDSYVNKGYTRNQLDGLFFNWLQNNVPEIRKGVLTGELTAQVKELIRVIGEDAIALAECEHVMTPRIIEALEADLNKFFSGSDGAAKVSKKLKDYTILERLDYIDNKLLTINGKRYGLNNLHKYIKEMHKSNSNALAKVTAILDYLGITVYNSKEIYNLMKLKDIDGLRGAMRFAKIGMADAKAIIKEQRALTKYINRTIPDIPLNVNDGGEAMVKFFNENSVLKTQTAEEVIKSITACNDSVVKLQEGIAKSVASITHETRNKQGEIVELVYDAYKLDRLTEYAGIVYETDETTASLLEAILKFDAKDTSFEALQTYRDQVFELQNRVKQWRWSLTNSVFKEAPDIETKQLVQDLYEALNKKSIDEHMVNVNDLLNLTDEVYRLQVSALGRYGLIDLEMQDPVIKEMFTELSKANSPLRANLQAVANELRGTALNHDAEYIDAIITRIDMHSAVARLLNTQLFSEEIPTSVADFSKGMLFNVIYENQGEFISKLTPKNLTERFMEQFRIHNKEQLIKYFTDNYYKFDIDVIDDSFKLELEDLEAKLKINGYLDEVDLDRYDELKSMVTTELTTGKQLDPADLYADFLNSVEDNVFAAFEKYLTELDTSGKMHRIMPTAYSHLDYIAISYMKHLGLDREKIVKKLMKTNVSDIQIEDTNRFIKFLVGDHIDTKLIDYQQGVQDLVKKQPELNRAATILELDGANRVLVEDSLSAHLQQAYKNIDALDSELGGGKRNLGRYYEDKYTYKNIKAYTTYVECNKVNQFIKENTVWSNAYAWSTANQFLSFEVDVRFDFLNKHSLSPIRVVDGNTLGSLHYQGQDSVLKFYNFYKYTANALKDIEINNRSLIQDMRETLAKVYQDPTLDVRPDNAKGYFVTGYYKNVWTAGPGKPHSELRFIPPISDKEVVVWATITRRPSFNESTALEYKRIMKNLRDHRTLDFNERIDYYSDKSALLADLDELRQHKVVTDVHDYDRLYEAAPEDCFDAIYNTIEQDIKTPIKDISALQANEKVFVANTNQHVDWLNNMRSLDNLKKDTRLVRDVIKNKQHRKILASYGVNIDKDVMGSENVLRFLYTERNHWLKESIDTWDAKQLRSWLDHHTDGVFIYVDSDDILDKPFLNKYTQAELSAAGLMIAPLEDAPHIYIVRRLDNKMTNVPYEYVTGDSIFPEQQRIITEILAKNRAAFNWEGMDVPDELFTGQLMDDTLYDVIREHKSIAKILGDEAEQKLYSKLSKTGLNTFHTKKFPRPNFTIIGEPSAFNTVVELCADDLRTKNIMFFKKSTNLVNSVWSGSLESIQRSVGVNKYAQLFFNDDYFIGNETFKPIFEKATDKEIKEFFGRNNFKAAVLKKTKSGKTKIFKIYIDSKASLQAAIKDGAVLMPHEVYRNAVLTINKEMSDSKFINMYKRTIVGTYKTSFLDTLGYLMRNFSDSSLYKNNASYHGVTGMWTMFKYQYKAAKMLSWYDAVQQEMFELTNGQTLNRKVIRSVLAGLPEEQRKTYMVIDAFINSSASGGLSKSFEEFLLKRNMDSTDFIGYDWEKWYHQHVLNNPYSKMIRDVNSTIEQTSRFGLFLALLEESGDYSKAIREVINTHFDYSLKEGGLELLEQLFWFSTFPVNNMMYYMNYGLTKNPSMLKLQFDMLEQSYNDGRNYTWDDVKNSSYLTYNALAGNIRFYMFGNDKDDWSSRLILKTGSSVLDFFSIICDPTGQLKDRLNPFIAAMLGYSDVEGQNPLEQLNPLGPYIKRGEQIITGKNYLPSVYAMLYPRKEYKRPMWAYASRYYRSSWNKPKKVYPKVRKYYAKNYYPQYHKRSYVNVTGVGYKWIKSTRGKKVYFYDNGSRVIRAAGKMRRALKKAKMPMYITQIKETRY